TVGQVMEAAETGTVAVHTPFQIKDVTGNGRVERVVLFHSEDETQEVEVECDAILLQLGFKTALGPPQDWGLEISKRSIVLASASSSRPRPRARSTSDCSPISAAIRRRPRRWSPPTPRRCAPPPVSRAPR